MSPARVSFGYGDRSRPADDRWDARFATLERDLDVARATALLFNDAAGGWWLPSAGRSSTGCVLGCGAHGGVYVVDCDPTQGYEFPLRVYLTRNRTL